MRAHKAYKVELDLNNKQRTALRKHAGAARWAYNWGLRQKIDAYEATGKAPSAATLHKQMVALKKTPQEEGGTPWLAEVSKWAPQEALRDLDVAYKNFFRRCKQGSAMKGFPRFKKKGQKNSFRLYGLKLQHIGNSWIQLPRLGKLRLKERGYLPTKDVKILSATVSAKAGRWFVSLLVEEAIPENAKPEHVAGVDVGSRKMAVTSDGEVFENPKALRKVQRRLAYLQRSVSRKQKGSSNRKKAIKKLQKQHYKVSCVRKDAIHKATTSIAKRATVIVLETLNIKGMVKNRHLARTVHDASMGEFHRQLEYKASWYEAKVIRADRFYPSSKTCSSCGHVKKDLGFAETYRCDACGLVLDRDVNAALNLKSLAGGSSVTACGEDVRLESFGRKAASVKQEPSTCVSG